jgi:hypothetical protein
MFKTNKCFQKVIQNTRDGIFGTMGFLAAAGIRTLQNLDHAWQHTIQKLSSCLAMLLQY